MGAAFSSNNALVIYANKPYYFPGETVEGAVALNLIERMEIKEIVLDVLGSEHVRYSFPGGRTRTYYSGHTDVLTIRCNLSHQTMWLDPGQYQYNFKFTLPPNLPPSFESRAMNSYWYLDDYAFIRYTLTAIARRTGLHKNIKAQNAFRVMPRSMPPTSFLRATGTDIVTAWCCIKQGSVDFTMEVDKNVYIPGDTAVINVQVRNKSKKMYNNCTVSLVENICLDSRSILSCPKSFFNEVQSYKMPNIPPGDNREPTSTQMQFGLHIPPTLQGTLISEHIRQTYTILINLDAGPLSSDVDICANIHVNRYAAPCERCAASTVKRDDDDSLISHEEEAPLTLNAVPSGWKPVKSFDSECGEHKCIRDEKKVVV